MRPLGDGPWTDSDHVVLEDAAHDGGFGRIDAPAAGAGDIALDDDLVAIGHTTRDAPLPGPVELATPDLLAQVREVELGHGARHADVKLGDPSVAMAVAALSRNRWGEMATPKAALV